MIGVNSLIVLFVFIVPPALAYSIGMISTDLEFRQLNSIQSDDDDNQSSLGKHSIVPNFIQFLV